MEFLQEWMNKLPIFLVAVFFVIGLLATVKGGDKFVDSASEIAEATGIPKLIIGATIVSLGTTLPELLVSISAAAGGKYDMAAGNAIGSITANTALVMSLSLIFMPMVIKKKDILLKTILMILPLFIMFFSAFKGNTSSKLPIYASILLLIIFAFNIGENVYGAKKTMAEERAEQLKNSNFEESVKEKPGKNFYVKNILWFILGAFLIFAGAQLLQTSAVSIASAAGVSEQMIALTIVAIGTSLPELVTTITAIIKKESNLSVGNIIGANIIDVTLILSICGIISGGSLPMSAQTILLDIPVCITVSLIALIPALIKGKFYKWQGFLNLIIYITYLVIIVIGVEKIGICI